MHVDDEHCDRGGNFIGDHSRCGNPYVRREEIKDLMAINRSLTGRRNKEPVSDLTRPDRVPRGSNMRQNTLKCSHHRFPACSLLLSC